MLERTTFSELAHQLVRHQKKHIYIDVDNVLQMAD